MLKAGVRVGPYEVLSQLGAGGMGEVWRARDTRLGRDVAIKVLPAAFASDPDRLRRFEQEARAVAALNHPTILALYDVGTHDGAPYIVTELLEGESLRERLDSGPVPVRRAVEIAVQVAQGLSAAHEKGIVHRDLKPANVFLTNDGRVKILDFGLAKLAPPPTEGDAAGATTVIGATGAGMVLGTVGYMSPEQVRGLAVDQRSDIFSLGCLLHEMIGGAAPFARETGVDTMSAILTKDPPELAGPGLAVPDSLEHVVRRCLEKEAGRRFASAHDLAFALAEASGPSAAPAPATAHGPAAWRTSILTASALAVAALLAAVAFRFLPRGSSAGPVKAAVPRVVVLPFENLGSPEDAYFASGMTDEITSRLASVQGLGVISRTTAAQYENTKKTVKQIGGELGVGYVLEGSVRWEHGADRASRVRITPELVRVADDTSIWSERYERVLADIFAIQSEVAESAVKAMGLTLVPREQTALESSSTSDMQAYDLYLRGRAEAWRSDGEGDMDAAIHLFQEAVDRDPHFAEALAGLARHQLRMAWFYRRHDRDLLLRAHEAAQRAVQLRPDLVETHDALGWYFYLGELDYARALDEFAAARRIQPNNSDVLLGVGSVYRRQGRWREAAEAMASAVEFDPKNAVLLGNAGPTYILARRYADADRILSEAIALSPRWAMPYGQRAWLQVLWHGDTQKASALLDGAATVEGLTDDAAVLAIRGFMVALARRDYAGELRRLDAEKRPTIANVNWYLPVPLLRGEVEWLADRPVPAHQSFDAARGELEKAARDDPNDSRIHSSLAIAYAGLGRSDDAVREGELACRLMPPSKDAWLALYRIADLALVYTMVGKVDTAIARLDELLAGSGESTPYVFRLDPRFDALRSDPRFQALLTGNQAKS